MPDAPHYQDPELDGLARSLAELTRTGRGHVEWSLCHVALERVG